MFGAGLPWLMFSLGNSYQCLNYHFHFSVVHNLTRCYYTSNFHVLLYSKMQFETNILFKTGHFLLPFLPITCFCWRDTLYKMKFCKFYRTHQLLILQKFCRCYNVKRNRYDEAVCTLCFVLQQMAYLGATETYYLDQTKSLVLRFLCITSEL